MELETPKAPRSAAPIRVRKMGFVFDDVPRHWFFGAAFPTHLVNGLNLVFPAGERFFIRSVRHYLSEIEKDPALLADVKAFFGQEGRHGLEHERAFEMLEKQGFEIRTFLQTYERIAYGKLEPMFGPHIRLASTAALEHFTATLAERALSEPFLDSAHPAMRDLLRWHACEEIEHKAVAFDVFQRVDGRYWVRLAGLVIGTLTLTGFWALATRHLLSQDAVPKEQLRRERKASREVGQTPAFLWKAIVDYVRPGFHPSQRDNYGLARTYLERIGRLHG
jgi:uncharacterized protein